MKPLPLVLLKDCCAIVSGSTPRRDTPEYWGGKISWATPKDISKLDQPILANTQEHITDSGLKSCSTRLLPEGSILFSSRAPIGLVAIAGCEMCTNQGFKNLIPGAAVDSRYLYWCMRYLVPRINAMGNGATFKEVSKSIMEHVEIPLPNEIAIQRHIATILDKADAIRRKRVESLRLADEFLKSVFLDMFGDPVTNPKGWLVRKLKELVKLGDRINYGVVQPGPDIGDGVPIVRVGDFRDGLIDQSRIKRIAAEIESKYRRSRLKGDEILIACVGSIGEVALADDRLSGSNIVRAVARVPLSNQIDRHYVAAYLQLPFTQSYFNTETRTVSQPTLNIAQIKETEIPVPSNSAMKEYRIIADLVQKEKNSLLESKLLLDNLFNSLVQRAFRGELSR